VEGGRRQRAAFLTVFRHAVERSVCSRDLSFFFSLGEATKRATEQAPKSGYKNGFTGNNQFLFKRKWEKVYFNPQPMGVGTHHPPNL
jgi:hypothetical protein